MAVRVPATLATIKVNSSGGVAKVLKNTSCVAGAMMLGTSSIIVFDFWATKSSNTEKTSQRSHTLPSLSGFSDEHYASSSLEMKSLCGMCWRCAAFVLLVRVWTRPYLSRWFLRVARWLMWYFVFLVYVKYQVCCNSASLAFAPRKQKQAALRLLGMFVGPPGAPAVFTALSAVDMKWFGSFTSCRGRGFTETSLVWLNWSGWYLHGICFLFFSTFWAIWRFISCSWSLLKKIEIYGTSQQRESVWRNINSSRGNSAVVSCVQFSIAISDER